MIFQYITAYQRAVSTAGYSTSSYMCTGKHDENMYPACLHAWLDPWEFQVDMRIVSCTFT